ncbi:MAG: lactonase family protein [Pirellulales bacterium]|nr:lactonase family protein [Pirellulales bacterium]
MKYHAARLWGMCVVSLMLGSLLANRVTAEDEPAGKLRVYFGAYNRGEGKGIYTSELDLASGKLSPPQLAGEAVNPSFLAIHPSKKFLYAVGEIDNFDGKKTGGVSAFSIDPKTGLLERINQHSSGGAGPCHLVVDASGKNVLVANYGGGSVACLPINDDGSLREASSFIQHQGSSVDPARQQGPHAHSINLDANNRFAVAADLGLDKLLVYRLDAEQGLLAPNDPPSVATPPGGGPRHFAFHPSGKFAFANNEMGSSVTAYSYDAASGTLQELNTVTTLPAGASAEGNSTAEIRVHPNGRFVYVSNRGHNSLAIFEVDASSGRLSPRGHASSGGKIPRNFNLDPSGKFLLAANQDSDNVVVYRVDAETGQLTPTGAEIEVTAPVCVRFVELP